MRFINYLKDCVAEMKKVVWPTKDEVRTSTKVVLLSLVFFSIILGLVDSGLGTLVKAVFMQANNG
jgi:preprotein translocase subunit SecE